MKVALIDYNISPTFKDALKSDVIPIMIEANDTFMTLKEKIISVKPIDSEITNVVVAQHFRSGKLIIGSEVVTFLDEETHVNLKQFLIDLKEIGSRNIDFLACLLYSQPGVFEMFAKLEAETGINLRASTDDTGNLEVGGNWIMESDMIDIEELYFTKQIEEFKELFYNYSNTSSLYSQNSLKKRDGTYVYLHVDISGRPINPKKNNNGQIITYPPSSLVITNTNGSAVGMSTNNSLVSSITDVIFVETNADAAAALKSNGAVVTWGGSTFGGNSNTTSAGTGINNGLQSGVVAIYSTQQAFAALKSDGSVVTWGNSSYGGSLITPVNVASSFQSMIVVDIIANNQAFAALTSTGRVISWGNSSNGGNSNTTSAGTGVNNGLQSGVVAIYNTATAFAALKSDGSVVTWGNSSAGGSLTTPINVTSALQSSIVDVIFANEVAFAALTSTGSVITWGTSGSGGNSSTTSAGTGINNGLQSGVLTIYSTLYAFAALKNNGSLVVWGSASYGGSAVPFSVTLANSNVLTVYTTGGAFAALKSDGSLAVWGDSSAGGSGAPPSVTAANSNVVAVYSSSHNTWSSFAALKSNGSVITWGDSPRGGDSSSTSVGYDIDNGLASNVVTIFSTGGSMAALKSNGSLVTWGYDSYGNSTSTNLGSTSANNGLSSGIITVYPSSDYAIDGGSYISLKPNVPVAISDYYYSTGASKIVLPELLPLLIDSSNASIQTSLVINKNIYNLNQIFELSVIPTGGNGAYSYSWSGEGLISTNNSRGFVNFRSGVSGEIITVTVSSNVLSGPSELTKTFNIRYVDPTALPPITDFSQTIPSNEYRMTTDNRIIADVNTSINSFIGNTINMISYVPPTGQNIKNIAIKFSEANQPNGFVSVSLDVDKYDNSGSNVNSVLNSAATYGTFNFDISAERQFGIVWKNPLGESVTMARYIPTSSPAIQTFYSVTLNLTSTVNGRNYFTYIGPNTESIIVVNPSGNRSIPCFVAGTRILTPTGEKLIESLSNGDLILTEDGRKVPATIYSTKIAKTNNETAPYFIPANAFRPHYPPQDITLSPKHAIKSSKNTWEIPQFADGRFPSIKKMCVGESVTYYHIELPNFFTDNIIANGSVCESLGNKIKNTLPKGQSIYSFNKKLNGFTRYNPEIKKSVKKYE